MSVHLTLFQSTHSLRSATKERSFALPGVMFQSTHSLRSATPDALKDAGVELVSIHALLAECDRFPRISLTASNLFQSTHSLRSATICAALLWGTTPFQSTHSLRSATRWPPSSSSSCRFQSTHSLRSATDFQPTLQLLHHVSIHALLAECDQSPDQIRIRVPRFQSTHSLRSATANGPRRRDKSYCFNPRTPCGVRLSEAGRGESLTAFQSTHSLRSATAADLIHCYSTEQIILCANLPKKTVIARLHFLSIYLSIFYSQCITPIADRPGNSCELEVGAQAMFNSL